MTLDWWPAPPAGPWTWRPAVHLAALALALAPTLLVLVAARLRGVALGRRRLSLLAASAAGLVLALGWPLADLAAVSLAGRTAQYIIITLAAAPLLLLGIPRWRATGRGLPRRLIERTLGSALVGSALLGGTVWITHAAPVVDELEATAEGVALVRTAWLLAAFAFWWPLIGPGPSRERLPYLAGLAYLILPFVFPKFPAAVWVFSSAPVYETYAALPDTARPGTLSATADQGLAGFILWLPGSILVAIAIYLLLRHWFIEDRRLGLRQRLGIPADPDAVAALVAHPAAWAALDHLVTILDGTVPPRRGSDLTFAVRRDRVVLQIHVPGTEEEQALLGDQIAAHYRAYLARLDAAQAESVRAHLSVEVLAYGSRVQ